MAYLGQSYTLFDLAYYTIYNMSHTLYNIEHSTRSIFYGPINLNDEISLAQSFYQKHIAGVPI